MYIQGEASFLHGQYTAVFSLPNNKLYNLVSLQTDAECWTRGSMGCTNNKHLLTTWLELPHFLADPRQVILTAAVFYWDTAQVQYYSSPNLTAHIAAREYSEGFSPYLPMHGWALGPLLYYDTVHLLKYCRLHLLLHRLCILSNLVQKGNCKLSTVTDIFVHMSTVGIAYRISR